MTKTCQICWNAPTTPRGRYACAAPQCQAALRAAKQQVKRNRARGLITSIDTVIADKRPTSTPVETISKRQTALEPSRQDDASLFHPSVPSLLVTPSETRKPSTPMRSTGDALTAGRMTTQIVYTVDPVTGLPTDQPELDEQGRVVTVPRRVRARRAAVNTSWLAATPDTGETTERGLLEPADTHETVSARRVVIDPATGEPMPVAVWDFEVHVTSGRHNNCLPGTCLLEALARMAAANPDGQPIKTITAWGEVTGHSTYTVPDLGALALSPSLPAIKATAARTAGMTVVDIDAVGNDTDEHYAIHAWMVAASTAVAKKPIRHKPKQQVPDEAPTFDEWEAAGGELVPHFIEPRALDEFQALTAARLAEQEDSVHAAAFGAHSGEADGDTAVIKKPAHQHGHTDPVGDSIAELYSIGEGAFILMDAAIEDGVLDDLPDAITFALAASLAYQARKP